MKIRMLRNLSMLMTLGVISSVPNEMYGYGYETANWKGVYVYAVKGGDGDLANGLNGKYLEGNTKWGSYEVPSEMTFDFESAQTLTRYTFATLDWDAGATSRSPKEWKLVASNDLENWTLLDEHTNGQELFTKARQLQEFTFENKLSYKYYKFIFEKIISGSIMGIADVNFPEFTAKTKPYFPENDLTILKEKLIKDADVAKATNNAIEVIVPVYSNNTTELGLVYSKEQSMPDLSTGSKVVGDYTTNPIFKTTITGLTPNTTYYVRPYAINEVGTSYGDVFTLTTSSDEKGIFSGSSASLNNRSSNMTKWTIGIKGQEAVDEYGIVWSKEGQTTIESGNKCIANAVTPESTDFTATMTNLDPHTLYYMRPYALTGGTVTYGTECAFFSRALEVIDWKEGATVQTDLTDDSYRYRNFLNKAFNGNLGNEFSSYAELCYMLFSFDKPHALNSYELANAQDSKRYPKSWNLLASNDKQTWTVLDSQTDYAWGGNKEKGVFEFDNSNGYKYYKLDVTKNGGAGYTGISHFDFPGYPNVVNSIGDIKSELNNVGAYANRQKQIVITNPDQEKLQVAIFNSVGQKIHTFITNSENTIVDQNFASGVYLIHIVSISGRRVEKLIIE